MLTAPAVTSGLYIETVLEEVKILAAYADEEGVKGFNRNKGLAPILPFFLQALMHAATPETREQVQPSVCWRMLMYADVCWRLLASADVC
jgi:hypothetical protein